MNRRAARWAGAALVVAALVSSPSARADEAPLAEATSPSTTAAPLAPPPACDPARVARLDRVLRDEARAAARWRWAWAGLFAGAAAGQLALAAADPFPDNRRHDARLMSLYLGAGKATIGLGARLVIPPRVARPALTGDVCADERALRAAIARTALRERRSMALNVFGGLALNVGTSLWLGLREDSWRDAGISFGMGTVVSIVSALTQPRRVWRQGGVDADGPLVQGAQLAPWSDGRARGLALSGTF